MAKPYISVCRISNTLLAWNPGTDEVELFHPYSPCGDLPEAAEKYSETNYPISIRPLYKGHARQFINQRDAFASALFLISVDKCDPLAVHKAFLGFDDYALNCSPELPGKKAAVLKVKIAQLSNTKGRAKKYSREIKELKKQLANVK